MGTAQHDDIATLKKVATVLAGILSVIVMIAGGIDQFLTPAKGFPLPSSLLEQLFHLTVIGAAVAALYGMLWSGVEAACEWKYGAGATKVLPRDVHALVLSMTLVSPLAVAPAVYQRFAGVKLMTPDHFIRNSLVVLLLSAMVHIALYGARWGPLVGFIAWVRASSLGTPLRKHTVISLIYYFAFAIGLALPYRALVGRAALSRASIWVVAVFVPPVAAFGIESWFVLTRHPRSLADYIDDNMDQSWVQVRGVIAGFLLVFALVFGMFLQ